jgi:hypothetical protein
MAAPKLKKAQREAVLSRVAELYLAGKTQSAIGVDIGVTQQQISSYLKTLQERWQIQAAEAIDARKARELARLDRLEREYWEAWARSCENGQTTVNRAKTISLKAEIEARGAVIEVPALEREWTHTEKGQVGNPSFLLGVQNCIEMRLRIVGGFADKAIVIKTPEDKIIEYLKAGKLDPAEVQARFPNKAQALFAQAGIVVTQGVKAASGQESSGTG